MSNVGMLSRVDELAQVADGGYLASLEVFHLLHCLVSPTLCLFKTHILTEFAQRQLRMWIYKENFYPSSAGSEDSTLRPHLGTYDRTGISSQSERK